MSQFGTFINRHLETLTKVGIVVALARSVLLIIDFPIVPIPYLDDFVFSCWRIIQSIMAGLSETKLLPRFALFIDPCATQGPITLANPVLW